MKIPLGSVMGSKQFSENYISALITQWLGEITELSLIAKNHLRQHILHLHQVTNISLHSSWELLKTSGYFWTKLSSKS